jgi:hypothetical protein
MYWDQPVPTGRTIVIVAVMEEAGRSGRGDEVTTKKPSDLRTRRVEAKITRKAAADACGISQFKLDKLERGVDVGEDVRKAYDTGLAKLLANAAKTSTTNGKARTSTAKKTTTRRTRKTAQTAETAA